MDMEVSEGAAIKNERKERIEEKKNPTPKDQSSRTFLDKLLGRNKTTAQPVSSAGAQDGSIPPELQSLTTSPNKQPTENASVLFKNDGTPKNNVIPHPDIDKKFPPNQKFDSNNDPGNIIIFPRESQLPEYLTGGANTQSEKRDNVVPFNKTADGTPGTAPQSGPEDPTVA